MVALVRDGKIAAQYRPENAGAFITSLSSAHRRDWFKPFLHDVLASCSRGK
jgi:hypothetical protein